MFIVILTVVALTDYLITFCCIVNLVSKPTVKTAETPKGISDGEIDQNINNAVMELVCDDEEFDSIIEEQDSRIALLSSNVNEILANIDSIIEKNERQRVVLG